MGDDLARRLRRAFRVVLLLVPLLGALWFVPGDDGLRHVGRAFGAAERAWGDIYPASVFETHAAYDPWWGYDRALETLGSALALVLPDRLVRQFVGLKLLEVIFLAALLGLAARRSRIEDEIGDAHGFVLAIVLLALVLTDTLARFSGIRPFAFGTLLLLYAVGRKGALRGFVSAGLATALYPYLAWIYIGPVVLAHLLVGSRSFALGAALAGLAGAAVQTHDLVGLVLALARAGGVRGALGDSLQITELAPATDSLGLVLVVLVGLFVLLPALPAERRRWRAEHVMLACFAPVALVHVRYVVDVVLPLLFVAYGADALRLAHGPFVRACRAWQGYLRLSSSGPSTPALRVGLVLAYALLLGGLVARSVGQHAKLASVAPILEAVPRGSLVLTRFNLQYRLLYARPDLSLVPSSELGFPRRDVAAEYVAYLRDGRVCSLAERVDAEFFVETRSGYVDATDSACLDRVDDGPKLRIWRVEAQP